MGFWRLKTARGPAAEDPNPPGAFMK